MNMVSPAALATMGGKVMTNNATINKLIEMHMTAMANAFRAQLQDHSMQGFSFDDRSGRKVNKSLIDRLSSCEYITEKHNVIVLGATGAGKSYIACAFGMEACKHYYTVKYIRLPELLAELAVARGEGSFKKSINQYKKYSLLILDEWMLVSLTETEARDLLEIIHSRHKNASTIFCSQFAPAGWHKKISEATLADAILDRIVHDSYTIEIQYIDKDHDKSMREVYGIDGRKKK
jgi:DNA replication protein DnaC